MGNVSSTSRATTAPANQRKLTLADLPSEILVRIFGYLGAQDLGSAARCSRRMKEIADADAVWKSLFLRRFGQPALLIGSVKVQYAVRADSERQERLRSSLITNLNMERSNAVEIYFSAGGRWYKNKHGKTLIDTFIILSWHSHKAFLSNLDAYLDRVRTTDPALRVWDPALNDRWSGALDHGAWMVQAFLDRGFDPEANNVPGCLHHRNGSVLQLARQYALDRPAIYQPLVGLLEATVRQRRERG